MNIENSLNCLGDVKRVIEWKDGRVEEFRFKNTVLKNGRKQLVKFLTNQSDSLFISHMLFGDGGTSGGVKKFVNDNRNGLFGTTRISKPVISIIDPTIPTQAIFTVVIPFDEGVGLTLNEMALQMSDGTLYSLTTFADLNKSESMQLTWSWYISFV